MDIIQDIRDNSEWLIIEDDFNLKIGSHSQNPNTTNYPLKRHTVIKWDGDSRDGKCWFIVHQNGKDIRGYVESGIITNMIKNKYIELYEMGSGHVIYSSSYVGSLLNK